MKIILIRHAEPDYSIDSLTPKGFREAKLLAERVKNWKVTKFYCSPLGRAQDTASFSLKACNAEAETKDWLQEFYYRIREEGTEKSRIAWDFMPAYFTAQDALHDKDAWMHTPLMQTGELDKYYQMVGDGLNEILREFGYEAQGRGLYRVKEDADREATIVLFCHLGVSFVMLSHLLGIASPALWQGFFVAPSSVTVLGSEERMEGEAAFRVQVMGDTRHLYAGDEPISASGYFTEAFQD